MQDHEERIINVLSSDTTIFDPEDQSYYNLITVGKPIVQGGGECKTDVYALYENMDEPDIKMELKISAKKENADFLENKLREPTARNILGENWAEIIYNAAIQCFSQADVQVFSPYAHGKTEAGSLMLGYRLDFLDKPGGDLSAPMITRYEDKLLVLSGGDEYGSIMSYDKTNPYVNGQQIANAGIANYMFRGNDYPTSAQEIFDGLVSIYDYAYEMSDIWAAFKGVNYRMPVDKYESRWLAAYVDWFADDYGVIQGHVCYNEPLMYSARMIKDSLVGLLHSQGISSVDQLVPNDNILEFAV